MATSKSNMFSSLSNSGNLAYEILDAAYMGILYFVVVSVVSRLIVMVDNALFPKTEDVWMTILNLLFLVVVLQVSVILVRRFVRAVPSPVDAIFPSHDSSSLADINGGVIMAMALTLISDDFAEKAKHIRNVLSADVKKEM